MTTITRNNLPEFLRVARRNGVVPITTVALASIIADTSFEDTDWTNHALLMREDGYYQHREQATLVNAEILASQYEPGDTITQLTTGATPSDGEEREFLMLPNRQWLCVYFESQGRVRHDLLAAFERTQRPVHTTPLAAVAFFRG